MSVRNALIKVHRWIGLAVGLFFAIASLSGAVLVYQPELQRLVNVGAYDVTDGDIGMPAAVAVALEQAPDLRLSEVRWPGDAAPAYRVRLAGSPGRTVWVDPGSGTVIRPEGRPRIVEGIRRLHTSLFTGSKWGRLIVEWSSIIALVGLLTGLCLWWPGIRRFLSGFRVRLRRDLYVFSYDTHQVLGAVMLPLLLLITFTGVLLPHTGLGRSVAHLVYAERSVDTGRPPPPPVLDAPVPASAWLPVSRLFESARTAAGTAEPLQVIMPREETTPALVQFTIGGPAANREHVLVHVHPADGRILAVDDPRTLPGSERLARSGWLALHVGAWGGPVARLLWALACLVGGFLVPTGVIVWWIKRTRIEAAAVRTAASVPERTEPGSQPGSRPAQRK